MTSCADVLAGRAPNRPRGRPQRLGAHPARLQGRLLVHPSLGRLVVPSRAGGGAEGPAELREGDPAPHLRLRDRGDRHHRALARQGPALRDAGNRGQGRRLGRRPGLLPDPAQAPQLRVPARGGAPAAAHQRDRRGDARAAHPRPGDPPLLSRARLLLGEHADHHRRRRRGRRSVVSGFDPGPGESATTRGKDRLLQGFLRPRDVSDRLRPAQRRGLLPRALQGLHVRARRSAPRTRTPAGTSPSSG